jgi:hypothetical protein
MYEVVRDECDHDAEAVSDARHSAVRNKSCERQSCEQMAPITKENVRGSRDY